MANNPMALPFLFTVSSLVSMSYSWDDAPSKVPIWWSAYANPIAWAPRWLGFLLFPLLELVIPYLMYQVASRDEMLDGQSGESANAIANIIALPALLIFPFYTLVYIPAAVTTGHEFYPRIFTANVAIWALIWLGYNMQFVEPNSSIGVPWFYPSFPKDLWTKTHSRAGVMLMVLGVFLFIFALACPTGVAYFVVTIVLWAGSYVLVLIDSYTLARTYVPSSPNVDGEASNLNARLVS